MKVNGNALCVGIMTGIGYGNKMIIFRSKMSKLISFIHTVLCIKPYEIDQFFGYKDGKIIVFRKDIQAYFENLSSINPSIVLPAMVKSLIHIKPPSEAIPFEVYMNRYPRPMFRSIIESIKQDFPQTILQLVELGVKVKKGTTNYIEPIAMNILNLDEYYIIMKQNEAIAAFNAADYDINGLNKQGFSKFGFNLNGYDRLGFDKNGIHKDTGTRFDWNGYDQNGLDKNGCDKRGFKKSGYNKYTKTKYDEEGFDRQGFNRDGINRQGYDVNGFDRDGYHLDGFNKDGIHKITRTQFNTFGYDKDGYDRSGYDWCGFDRNHIHRDTRTEYDLDGKDWLGFSAIPDE